MAIQINSSAFEAGRPIPKKHTGEGADVSPPLVWSSLPEGTAELALICDDPDAPTAEPWVHWVIYNIPADSDRLPEAVPATEKLETGALQGRNNFGKIGYGGPCPPRGKPHRYFFRLYALDGKLAVGGGLTRKALLEETKGHVLETAELYGTYGRS